MMYRLTNHRGEGDNSLRFAIFPMRDANFVEIKYQFGYNSPVRTRADPELLSRETLSLLASAALLGRHRLFG
jgi:hypothetical protein